MDLFGKLTKKAKGAAKKVDWVELNKKKDQLSSGAKQIKDDYEVRQRQKKEDWLSKKENKLKALEKKLYLREQVIKKKEIKLRNKFFLRFIFLAAGFSMIGIFILISEAPQEEAPYRQKEEAAFNNKKIAYRESLKIYKPNQLNRMINSGQYPNQGPVNNTQTKAMSFSACKVAVDNTLSPIRGSYPVKIIVNTRVLYMAKAWTNDGVVMASCSEPDRKMVMTQASYM